MSEKISEYITSVTALASGDLMDVSKLISTSPLEYQSQKLNYSVLLTELNADLSITLQSIYNASTQPQILTSVAKGGLVIRSGQALDTNSVLELKNIAGSSTFVVGGNGIVATGNWQATAIAAAFGGTGQSSYTIGDIIYASNTTAISKLGIGTSGQVLTVSGGGIPTWAAVSSSNLGSANLTSADDARTFTLKSGTTSSQNFQIKNSAGKTGLYFDGVGRTMFGTSTVPADIGGEPVNFVMGDATTGVTANTYLTNTGASQYTSWRIYGGSALIQYYDSRGGQYWRNQNGLGTDIEFRQYGNAARITISSDALGTWGTFMDMTAETLNQIRFRAAGSTTATKGGVIEIWNGAGAAIKSVLTGNRSQVEACWFADGVVLGGARYRAATPLFDVMGAGATASTKTALFQNSASVSALTIKDDLYCIFRAKDAVIPDADLANNELSFYIEEATNDLHFKVKYSTGTVKIGKVNLI